LIGSALVGFSVRQHARADSISNTSCEQSGTVYRKTLLQIVLIRDPICIQQFADTPKPSVAGIV
jgi:hypothetical protein